MEKKERRRLRTPLGTLKLTLVDGRLLDLRLPRRPPRAYRGPVPGSKGDWAELLELPPPAPEIGTAFQRRIWAAAAGIPPGETLSYVGLARIAGSPRAPRAVGQALGANPLPLLIPCHRVVRSDGSLGGFGPGTAWKIFLLGLERGDRG